MKVRGSLIEAVDRLADRIENGHLLSATNSGEDLLVAAAQKLDDLQARVETAEAARDAAIKEMTEAARKLGYVQAENDALRYAMREAVGGLECADCQSIASDDQIIMEHVRLASKTLRIAMAKKGQPR